MCVCKGRGECVPMYFTNRSAQLSDDDAVFFTSAPGYDGLVHVGVSDGCAHMGACL